ncbi:MAG: DUF1702 family protein [Bacteroidota bacterium]
MDTVQEKIQTIQHIFRQVQEGYIETTSVTELVQQAEKHEPEFRSIAYEATSFCLALSDFKNHNQPESWFQFLQLSSPHATQIHVGLGWAMAQLQLNPLIILDKLTPMMRYRVLDGYGYYEGIFRKRKSILSQQKPELNDRVGSSAYDQGLGRSLWYLYNGSIAEVKNLIAKFPAMRQADLWRGMGIAVTYAGGAKEVTLKFIFDESDEYKKQLAAGAIMALVSRHFAAFITDDAVAACNIWCGKSRDEALNPNVPVLNSKNENAYADWVSNIEQAYET